MGKIECCYKCKDRYITTEDGKVITCHSTCKEYIKERKQLDEENAEKIRKANIENNLDSQYFDSMRKTYKRKRSVR